MSKSITQMTKLELIEVVQEKNRIIANLNTKIDDLEGLAVKSQAEPMDSASSQLLHSLIARIKKLERIINEQSNE
jgi:hypothetical protein